jgi:hypothetical protein
LVYADRLKNYDFSSKFKFLHLTLTVKNCFLVRLLPTFRHMVEVLPKFLGFFSQILGYIRFAEVTFKVGSLGISCHPHFHILLAVPLDYGREISHDDFVDGWRDALGVDYFPSVWIKAVDSQGYFYELIKYLCKPVQLLDFSQTDFEFFVFEFKGFKIISSAGCLRGLLNENLSSDDFIQKRNQKASDDLIEFYWSGKYYVC